MLLLLYKRNHAGQPLSGILAGLDLHESRKDKKEDKELSRPSSVLALIGLVI